MTETIESFVLWDADWQDEDLHLDVDLETSRLIKERLSITNDYYTAIPPDPNSLPHEDPMKACPLAEIGPQGLAGISSCSSDVGAVATIGYLHV